ncbi:toxin-antitoxin system, toxin component, GNAT family [Dichomitus squalens]|uniref:Toxin-antitoxin system, toxin component, GNAT family n=1 Tax=Dichomitus squalens TaxID=114155 RepID=A0A4Q9N056_9APHY|nr:toxin-antitoxin system, toxin component, GNAT family [Dichomitus squalens]
MSRARTVLFLFTHNSNMVVTFRDASEADLPAILDIYNEQILHGTATFHTEPQTLAQRADAGSTRTVGWCNLWHYKERPAYDATAELSSYVHESLRGKGILEETRKHGERFHVVIASVTTENERTMKFWAEHGFELRGTVKEMGRKFGR